MGVAVGAAPDGIPGDRRGSDPVAGAVTCRERGAGGGSTASEALALSGHVGQLGQAGVPVPTEVDELAPFLTDPTVRASRRQRWPMTWRRRGLPARWSAWW